jgi:hypothetical protein
MARPVTFDQLLDAVEELPPDEQAELIDVVRRRLIERGRQRVIDEVRQARSEFSQGKCKPTSVDDLMNEIES